MRDTTNGVLSKVKVKIKYLPLLVFVSFLLSGCAGLIMTEQPEAAEWGTLSAGQTTGQTFVAKYDGLAGIYFYLSPQETGDGEIRLHLRSSPQAVDDLAVSMNTLPVAAVGVPGYFGFFVPAQASSNQQYYYAFLEVTGSGTVQAGKAAGDSYLNGAFYQNGTPEDTQAAFQLSYSRRKAILGLGGEVLTWIGILAAGFFLFILPGWGIFSLCWTGWGRLKWPEKLAVSAGLSLALSPLLILWTDLIGLHLGALYAWLPPVAGLGMILWQNRKRLKMGAFSWQAVRTSLRAEASSLRWTDVAFLVIMALVFFTRFWAIRLLDAPQWSDSIQHIDIAQLMLDHGGLFKSWLPYAPYQSFTIQFGFPASIALFAWLTGLGSLKATLIIGQIINGLSVLTLYPLAVRLARGNRWAGIGAILYVGLLSPLPAYYVNWGRYAQLAGQTVLPVALWLVWEALVPTPDSSVEKKNAGIARWVPSGVSALVLAGMMLVYYRMPFYYATFILALLVAWGLPQWRLHWHAWRPKLGLLLAVAALGGLLFLPWGLRLIGSHLAGSVARGVANGSTLEIVLADYKTWLAVFSLVPKAHVIVALAALVWSLVKKNWAVAALGLWVMLLSAISAARLIHLPGANMMESFAILVALYIPVGLAIGWLVGEIAGSGKRGLRQGMVAAAVFVVAILGALEQRSTSEPFTFTYVTRPDATAMTWIREELPDDSIFLVEGVIFKRTSIIGSDAGLWIPLLAGKQNTIPPQYALTSEVPVQSGHTQRMVALVKELETIPLDSTQGVALLCAEGITHVYIGQMQGNVVHVAMTHDYPPLFLPEDLLFSNYFQLLYHQDRVYVFALKTGACP